jgi:hypothetical protein
MRQAPIGQKENVEKGYLKVILTRREDFVESLFPGSGDCKRSGGIFQEEA